MFISNISDRPGLSFPRLRLWLLGGCFVCIALDNLRCLPLSWPARRSAADGRTERYTAVFYADNNDDYCTIQRRHCIGTTDVTARRRRRRRWIKLYCNFINFHLDTGTLILHYKSSSLQASYFLMQHCNNDCPGEERKIRVNNKSAFLHCWTQDGSN